VGSINVSFRLAPMFGVESHATATSLDLPVRLIVAVRSHSHLSNVLIPDLTDCASLELAQSRLHAVPS
jgi:hypothetical protein